MMNHPSPGLRGVRRYILEPSSNRLAEQCDVAHLARTLVHFPPQGEPPWPHPSQFEYTPHKKKICTRKAIPPPAVAQSYLLVMSTMIMTSIISTFSFFVMWKHSNILKTFINIVIFYFFMELHMRDVLFYTTENWRTLMWRFFSFLTHLRQEVRSSTTASNPFKLFKQVTDHTAHWSGFSWTFLNFSDIYDSPSVNCFLASPCFYPNSKRIKQITEKGKEAA